MWIKKQDYDEVGPDVVHRCGTEDDQNSLKEVYYSRYRS